MSQPLEDATNPERWLRAYAGVQRAADREILANLRTALRQLQEDLKRAQNAVPTGGVRTISEQLRIYQMQLVRQSMLREQGVIFRKLGEVVSARRVEAALRASELGSTVDDILLRAGLRGAEAAALKDALEAQLNGGTIDTMVMRMTESRFPLSERIYRTQVWMDGRLETKINSALARGLTAKQFAAEAVDWFNPDTPGGVRYASLRLARTEINNAYHATAVRQAQGKPWLKGMAWRLSSSHPKADSCDILAHSDFFNLGEGIYPAVDVPRKPHPQCLCVAVPEPMDEAEFLDALAGGKFDDHLGVGHLPGPKPFVPPERPVTAPSPRATKRTAPKPEKSAEERAAAQQAKEIKAHINHITSDMPAGPVRDSVRKELAKQAKVAPKSVLALQRVQGGPSFTAVGRKFLRDQGKNTGAVYWNGQRMMEIAPDAFEAPEAFKKAFSSGSEKLDGGWHSFTDRPGLESVVAHEFGHHINTMFSGPGFRLTEDVADELFKVLQRELRIIDRPTGSHVASWELPGVGFQEFDAWVKSHKSKLTRWVSKYGSSNGRELLAEIWSEYTTAKSPRPYIKEIGRIMQELAERFAGRRFG